MDLHMYLLQHILLFLLSVQIGSPFQLLGLQKLTLSTVLLPPPQAGLEFLGCLLHTKCL